MSEDQAENQSDSQVPPGQKGMVDASPDESEGYLRSLGLRERSLDPERVFLAEGTLLANIRRAEKRTIRMSWYRRTAVAAAVLLVLCGGLYEGHRWPTSEAILQTGFGEVRQNRLPDGTEIVSNADTRIRYSPDWKDGKDREVWLKGEAFFHVSKTPLKSRFVVHTDHFDILVTGTKFNAVNRLDKASIVLEEGSVTLLTPDRAEMKMVPGDFIEYRNGRLEKRPIRADSVLAWKEHILVFNNTPLWQLVGIVRDDYGILLQPADEATSNKPLFGILRNDNLDVLLRTLEMTGEFKVEHTGDKIIIHGH